MAEGFITRRGGVGAAERTTSPSINFVSKTGNQIVVTFTNFEANEVDIFYGITSTLTDKVTVLASGTSSNVIISGLDGNTPYTISAYAIVTDATLKKIKSEVVSTNITTSIINYINATGGTILTYEDNSTFYKSHTFTSSGNFVVNSLGSTSALNEVDYLIIAGGAGGGGDGGVQGGYGGGGAGGYRTTNGTSGANSTAESKITVTEQSYTITIGAGGAGGVSNVAGGNGINSSALGITSIGGGGGGAHSQDALSGGSGGGGSAQRRTGGSGTTNQGFSGGNGTGNEFGGGGGGAGEIGKTEDGSNAIGSKGGDGIFNTLRNGTSEIRAGGGGGGVALSFNAGSGGAGGGGAGGTNNNGLNAVVNTGGGGGGSAFWSGGSNFGGNGGSGIVIIRYEVGGLV